MKNPHFFKDIPAFSSKYMPPLVLQHLLKSGQTIETFTPSKEEPELNLYKQGHKTNHFTLIISGSGDVVVGRDSLKYNAQTFSYFGVNAIIGKLT